MKGSAINMTTTVKTLAIAALLLPLGCKAVEAVGGAIGGPAGHAVKAAAKGGDALQMNEKDEKPLGEAVSVALADRYGLSQDQQLTRYVNLVGLTIASVSNKPDGNWVFGVLDTQDVNAFAGPGGYIYLTRGLLDLIQNEAELAGVLAHEIAHVINKDGLHQVKGAKGKAALVEATQADERAAQFTQVADLGVDVITRGGYSQAQEGKADTDAVPLLIAAGYNPNAYVALLQRMQSRQSSGGGVMSTHPAGADRIQRIQAKIPPGTKGQTLPERFGRYAKK